MVRFAAFGVGAGLAACGGGGNPRLAFVLLGGGGYHGSGRPQTTLQRDGQRQHGANGARRQATSAARQLRRNAASVRVWLSVLTCGCRQYAQGFMQGFVLESSSVGVRVY